MSDPMPEQPHAVVQLTAMLDSRQAEPSSSLTNLTTQRVIVDEPATPIAGIVASLRAWADELEQAHGLAPGPE